MRREIRERVCDECGKKEQATDCMQFGVNPFCGWITARIEGEDDLSSSHDFCSAKCAGKHFTLFEDVCR